MGSSVSAASSAPVSLVGGGERGRELGAASPASRSLCCSWPPSSGLTWISEPYLGSSVLQFSGGGQLRGRARSESRMSPKRSRSSAVGSLLYLEWKFLRAVRRYSRARAFPRAASTRRSVSPSLARVAAGISSSRAPSGACA
eukprot:2612613-Amphidinium_carterae.1